MTLSDALGLEQAVLTLSSEIAKELMSTPAPALSEEDLWHEAICCMLSSQVTYSSAVAVAGELSDRGLIKHLAEGAPSSSEVIVEVLKSAIHHYRFPNVAVRRITGTLQNLQKSQNQLSSIVSSRAEPEEIRMELVRCVVGFGPKQASMFLRNIGVSSDLAILDRHVLRFMGHIKLIASTSSRSLPWTLYREYEQRLKGYSSALGYSVGCVDSAIWIVMRVAGRARP